MEPKRVAFEVLDCGEDGITDTAAGQDKLRRGIKDGGRIQRRITGGLEGDIKVTTAIEQGGIDAIDDGSEFGFRGCVGGFRQGKGWQGTGDCGNIDPKDLHGGESDVEQLEAVGATD